MKKILIPACILILSSQALAQDQSPRNNRGQRQLSIPENVFKSVVNDERKAESILSDLRLMQSAGLPLESYVELKLTAEQKKSLVDIVQSNQSNLRELMRNNDTEAVSRLRNDMLGKVKNILTDDQKNIVSKYARQTGRERPGRDGRGGRPGNPPIF